MFSVLKLGLHPPLQQETVPMTDTCSRDCVCHSPVTQL